MSLLKIEGLTFTYAHSDHPVLKRLNFQLEPGECAFVFGLNGSGKSTFALAAAGVLLKVAKGELDGRIELNGESVFDLAPHKLVQNVGLVVQDPDLQAISMTVADEVAYPLKNLGFSDARAKSRVSEVLELVGLSGYADLRPDRLSHGQKQLLALGVAVAARPKLLVLDEPTAYLDPEAEQNFWNVVQVLKNQGTGVVIMESWPHVPEFADSVYSLVDGKLIDGIEFRMPNPMAKQGIRLSDLRPVFDVEALRFSWGDRILLKNANFTVPQGITMLLGANGSGKTTLTKLLMGILRPQEGVVRFDGKPVWELGLSVIGRRVGYLFQNPERQLICRSVLDEVMLSLRAAEGGAVSEDRAMELLEYFGIQELADRFPLSLSASEKKRAALASLLALDPEFFVLDEPESGLDPLQLANFANMLERLAEMEKGIFLTTKNFRAPSDSQTNASAWLQCRLSANLLELRDGKVIAK